MEIEEGLWGLKKWSKGRKERTRIGHGGGGNQNTAHSLPNSEARFKYMRTRVDDTKAERGVWGSKEGWKRRDRETVGWIWTKFNDAESENVIKNAIILSIAKKNELKQGIFPRHLSPNAFVFSLSLHMSFLSLPLSLTLTSVSFLTLLHQLDHLSLNCWLSWLTRQCLFASSKFSPGNMAQQDALTFGQSPVSQVSMLWSFSPPPFRLGLWKELPALSLGLLSPSVVQTWGSQSSPLYRFVFSFPFITTFPQMILWVKHPFYTLAVL